MAVLIIVVAWMALLLVAVLGGRRTGALCPCLHYDASRGVVLVPHTNRVVLWRDQSGHGGDLSQWR